jgi:diguanylate cyclase (GGDEF)-like protein
MRHVILYSGGEATPAPGLLEALRAAHFTATVCGFSDDPETPPKARAESASGTSPLAVLFDLGAGVELHELHAAAGRAALAWPDLPLVACRRADEGAGRDGSKDAGQRCAARFDDAVLKRLGFHAVAAGPAQVAAVLREVEDGGVGSQEAPPVPPSMSLTPASLLLPERLSSERLRAAFEVVASLHFAADQKSAAQAALAGLAALIRADRWTIYLVSEAPKARDALFEPLAARGLTHSERQIPEDDWGRLLAGDALSLAGAHSRAARECVSAAEIVRRCEGARRVVAVPLIAGERVAGVLEAVREGEDRKQFTRADASLLSALALPLSAALSNSVRVAEAERLSQTDDLTKLHNARYLRQYLTGELRRARRYGSEVTAIFLDLDDFKRINDRHGHLVGSHVLMEMAAVILASVRDTDVVARYGGDEFVVILPETGIEKGLGVAERVRERVSRHAFTGGRGLRLSLTASFGVASFPRHAQSPQQLISCADTAMYEAKAAHKNCVRFTAEAAAEA